MVRADRKPVMIFSGEFWRGASGSGLANGFRKTGWAVHELDLSRHVSSLGDALYARVAHRLLTPPRARAFEQMLREAVATLEPDLFLTIKGTRISRNTLSWLRERGVPTVIFYPDFHFRHHGVSLDDFGLYDLIFTTKTFHIDELGGKFGTGKVHYVPHGYSDDVHTRLYSGMFESDYAVDLQHIGAHSLHKQRWLHVLGQRLPNASYRICGARWRSVASSDLPGQLSISDSIYDCAYSRALQTARINVAVMFGPDPSGWEDKVSTRTFEIPACGGFMLHVDNEEVREFFTPGKEIDVFSTSDELADKARFYLSRPDLRRTMIERAYERCVPAYGYAARAEQMMRTIKAELGAVGTAADHAA